MWDSSIALGTASAGDEKEAAEKVAVARASIAHSRLPSRPPSLELRRSFRFHSPYWRDYAKSTDHSSLASATVASESLQSLIEASQPAGLTQLAVGRTCFPSRHSGSPRAPAEHCLTASGPRCTRAISRLVATGVGSPSSVAQLSSIASLAPRMRDERSVVSSSGHQPPQSIEKHTPRRLDPQLISVDILVIRHCTTPPIMLGNH